MHIAIDRHTIGPFSALALARRPPYRPETDDMARTLNKLTARAVASAATPGVLVDGGGLRLVIGKDGSKKWVFRFTLAGSARELGLGPVTAVSLAQARARAAQAREQVAAGVDPVALRAQEKRAARANTFRNVMEDYLATKVAALRNPKHKAQWRTTLETYAAPLLDKPPAEIETADVVAVLKPIWTTKPETASRVRGRIESILNAAKTSGLRQGENPAAWRGHLANILPPRGKLTRGHFAARDWRTMPALMAGMDSAGNSPVGEPASKSKPASKSTSAQCLLWIIFTACRSEEARGARWSEIDFDAKIWTIPAERTKTARTHRVPLTDAALDVLDAMKPHRRESDGPDGLVFPGGREGRPLTDVAVTKALRAHDDAATVHGMRSAFRDWAHEATDFPREIAEQALAHVVGDATERAYRRGDALDRRRALMEAWAAYLAQRPAKSLTAQNVVPFTHPAHAGRA